MRLRLAWPAAATQLPASLSADSHRIRDFACPGSGDPGGDRIGFCSLIAHMDQLAGWISDFICPGSAAGLAQKFHDRVRAPLDQLLCLIKSIGFHHLPISLVRRNGMALELQRVALRCISNRIKPSADASVSTNCVPMDKPVAQSGTARDRDRLALDVDDGAGSCCTTVHSSSGLCHFARFPTHRSYSLHRRESP